MWPYENPARFDAEKTLIARYYSGSKIIIGQQVEVYTKFSGRINPYYIVKIVYPEDFPDDYPPEPYIVEPIIKDALHMLGKSMPCIGTRSDFSPATSGKMILDWTRKWIQAYEIYRATGHWPDFNEL